MFVRSLCFDDAERKLRRHAAQTQSTKRPTGVSGLAATLLRDKIAPFDTPQYRRKFGELVAGAVRLQGETPASRRKIKTPDDSK